MHNTRGINQNLYIITYSGLLGSPKIINYYYVTIILFMTSESDHCNIKGSKVTRYQMTCIIISKMLKNKKKLEGAETILKYV